jgi:SAM-dependent methyltransferase
MLKQLRRSNLAGSVLWQEHWREFDEIRFDAESLRWDGFLDLVENAVTQGPVLEAGCGMGRYLLYLRSRGARVAGVDFAAEPLAMMQRKVGPVPVAVADIRQLPFPTETFGTILCLGVIEHFEAGSLPLLRELARTLRPGGVAIVTVPYANALKRWRARRSGGNIVPASAPTPAGWTFYQFCYQPHELLALLEQAGLTVVGERRIGKLFNLAGWLQRVLVRARSSPRGSQRGAVAEDVRHAGPSGRTARGVLKRLIKQSALSVEPLLPAPLLAHMTLAVARKPARNGS